MRRRGGGCLSPAPPRLLLLLLGALLRARGKRLPRRLPPGWARGASPARERLAPLTCPRPAALPGAALCPCPVPPPDAGPLAFSRLAGSRRRRPGRGSPGAALPRPSGAGGYRRPTRPLLPAEVRRCRARALFPRGERRAGPGRARRLPRRLPCPACRDSRRSAAGMRPRTRHAGPLKGAARLRGGAPGYLPRPAPRALPLRSARRGRGWSAPKIEAAGPGEGSAAVLASGAAVS